jgi:hypothetical protein
MNDFFNYASLQSLEGENANAKQRLAELFGRCMATPEAVRVRLRVSARSTFLADHHEEVANLDALFARLVRS